MTDYYPLIARAVAGLDKSTGEARRALYERARTALVDQLRADAGLTESDITRERLALEEAIRKVEAEASRQPRAQASQPEAPPAPPRRLSDEARRDDAPPRPPIPPRTRSQPDQLPASDEAKPARPSLFDSVRSERSRTGLPRSEMPRPQTPRANGLRPRSPGAEPSSPSGQGLKGFRDVVAEANELGGATAQASRSARETYASVPSPSPEFDRMEPRVEPEGLRPTRDPAMPTMLEQPGGADDFPPPPPPRQVDTDDEDLAPPRPPRHYGGLIKALAVILILGGLSGLAYWQWGRIVALTQVFKSEPPPQQTATPSRPKIPDRVGQDQRSQPTAAVAQRVVLYEEEPGDPQGKRYVGSAIWRTETVSPGPGLTPELAVRADVEIPERRIGMTWSLRRNTDQSLPASHTIEIMFTLPPDFPAGGISNVPGILMKQAEQTRGVPLAGLSVKVTPTFFLIGLSAVEAEMQRNVQLLTERSWFDIPVVYTNGRRAILAMEKGTPGERAFDDAFRAWGSRQ